MAAKKSGIRSFGKWVLFILTILSSLCLLLSYVGFYISPSKVWFLAFFGLAYPVILTLNVLFVILWLILLKKYIWIPLITILIGINHVLSFIQIRSTDHQPVSGSLKVISYNIHGESEYYKKPSQNGNLSAVIEFLNAEEPDILCLQEFFLKSPDSSAALKWISEEINMKYSFFKNYYKKYRKQKIDALVIFSKYPILRSGFLQDNHNSTCAIYADIKIYDEIIRVYNIHLESFQFGQDDYTFYSTIAEAETPKTPLKEGSMKILMKLRKGYEFRTKQVDNLRTVFNSSPYPILVCGDLNDTPTSYTYQVLTKGMLDSFKKAGSGFFGNTYSGNFPSFRIDYILYDKKFEAYNYRKHKIMLSDHYPISAYINIHPAK